MAPATTLNAGGANIVIALSTGSGVGKDASGAITLDNLITTSNIKIVDNGPGSQGSASGILGASSSSLITANSVAFDIGGNGGSLGTASEPIRIAVSNLTARSQNGSVSLISTQNVTVGGAALANGVSGITSFGPITLSTAGDLIVNEAVSTQGGIVLSAGGTGKTITNTAVISTLTSNAPITLRADNMALEAGTIKSGLGRVTFMPDTKGRDIILGTDDPTRLSLSDAELDGVTTTGVLQIGTADTGKITISSAVDTANLSVMALINGNAISQTAPITEQNLQITSSGEIALTDLNNNIGVISATVTTVGNPIKVVNASDLTVGTVDGISGISAQGSLVALTVAGSEKKLINNNQINGNEITLQADQMVLAGGSVNAGSGRVTLQPNAIGRAVNLGDSTDPSGTFSLSDAELDTIKTSGTLQIGNAGVGLVLISAPINTANVSTMALMGGPNGINQTAPIIEENLRIESIGPVLLTDPNNDIGTLSANVTAAGAAFAFTDTESVTLGSVDGVTGVTTNVGAITINIRIILDDKIANPFLSDASPVLTDEQWRLGPFGMLRLDVLTEQFVKPPESPCKGEGHLMEEATLTDNC
jgi:hypothetical protein